MRAVARFEDERSARLFADVLCARHIDTEVSKGRDGVYSVWVLEEADLEASRAAWAAFDAAPDAPEHLASAGCVEKKTRTVERAERRSRHEIIDVSQRYRPEARRLAPLTLLLVVASITVWVVGDLVHVQNFRDALYIESLGARLVVLGHGMPAGSFAEVRHGQVWRLVTPIFLHSGIFHLLFNMWWLLDLGSTLENRIGTLRLLVLVTLSAVLSNSAQYVIVGPAFGGMSGVVYALFGYLWIRGRFDPTMGFALTRSTVVILLVWMLLGFTGQIGQIANYAHLGGLVAGALLGGLAALFSRR
jgi:GlpG protein